MRSSLFLVLCKRNLWLQFDMPKIIITTAKKVQPLPRLCLDEIFFGFLRHQFITSQKGLKTPPPVSVSTPFWSSWEAPFSLQKRIWSQHRAKKAQLRSWIEAEICKWQWWTRIEGKFFPPTLSARKSFGDSSGLQMLQLWRYWAMTNNGRPKGRPFEKTHFHRHFYSAAVAARPARIYWQRLFWVMGQEGVEVWAINQ